LAVLDMTQKDIVKVKQEAQFEDIWITLC
jgi:chromatin segregation and condensation protein Rec8/ScpA/Scc1 (kleisin family)